MIESVLLGTLAGIVLAGAFGATDLQVHLTTWTIESGGNQVGAALWLLGGTGVVMLNQSTFSPWDPRHPHAPVTAATYAVNGRQYVVAPSTGNVRVAGPKGDAWVAFALPKK